MPAGMRVTKMEREPKRLDAILDVAVEAVDDGGHGDHAGDADDDAEDGQGGADLARAQGVERDEQVFDSIGRALSSQRGHPVSAPPRNRVHSVRSATTGSSREAFSAG